MLPAVTGQINCGGEEHRITWRRGRLLLEDHDLLAERALTALGAEPPICLQVLDAWRFVLAEWKPAPILNWSRRLGGFALLHDLLLGETTLTAEELARRKAAHEAAVEAAGVPRRWQPMLPLPPMQASALNKRFERQAAERLAQEKRMWATTLIEALPAALRRPLGLSVIVSMERHWHDPAFRSESGKAIEPVLAAIAAPLFEQSARRWRRNLKPYALFWAECWVLGSGHAPTCAAWGDSGGAYAALALPISWFADVWARGIALVDGCLVLSTANRPGDHTTLHVRALRWERLAARTSKSVNAQAVVTRDSGGEWRLRWT